VVLFITTFKYFVFKGGGFYSHADLRVVDHKLFIHDNGSSNGSLLNNVGITPKR